MDGAPRRQSHHFDPPRQATGDAFDPEPPRGEAPPAQTADSDRRAGRQALSQRLRFSIAQRRFAVGWRHHSQEAARRDDILSLENLTSARYWEWRQQLWTRRQTPVWRRSTRSPI